MIFFFTFIGGAKSIIIYLFEQEHVKKTGNLLVDEILLEGHLGITKELLKYMSSEKKYYYGSEESNSVNLVKVNFIST